MKYSLLLLAACFAGISSAQWDKNTTPTYAEVVAICSKYARDNKEIEWYAMGASDYGLPIYTLIINGAQDSLRTFEKARNNTTILINNAIHPGEPDGVNALLLWLEEWTKKGKPWSGNTVLAVVPAYNIGGMHNRSSTSRANQDGPAEYGFRGNAQNLDLNRDFIKMDSKNAFTFARLFQGLDPDVFIDNHVTNGADYQYVLTLISSMQNRLEPSVRKETYENMLPALTEALNKRKWAISPYVDMVKSTPDDGLIAFNDLPRYSMGYASLFHTLSFTVETHMLKPFPQRVQATKAFMEEVIAYCSKNASSIEKARQEAKENAMNQPYYSFGYSLDTMVVDKITFLGYAAKYKKSEVTGLDRLYYERKEPWQKEVPYYQHYVPKDSILIPRYYVVKQQATNVIERLKANGVEMQLVTESTQMEAETQRIIRYKSTPKPYENHFLHSEVLVELVQENVTILPGDYLISTQQDRANFIHSVLNAGTEDSYFAWNFMDSYLDEKEYFSPYVFEDIAAELLKKDTSLKQELERKKSEDSEFAKSQWAQLFFVYQHSPYFEKTIGLLPVYRVN